MKELIFVIIGNGVAGFNAAQSLIKGAPTDSKILMFSSEKYGYYLRPKLYEFLRQDLKIEDVISYSKEYYSKLGIELHLEEEIIAISPKDKIVISTVKQYSYDRLLLANGAECYCPVVPGINLLNSFSLRSLDDAIAIRTRMKTSKQAVIIGGGLLGLEVASACAERGLNTSVIEFFPYLLPRQLDAEGGKILQNILEKNQNITFYLGVKVQEILGKDHVEGIKLLDGIIIPTDIVMTCTGITPRIDIFKKIGMKTNRGVIVNDFLETSIQDIYAAGDIAEHRGKVYGIIPPSIEQAKVAAQNMMKPRSVKYTGSKLSTSIKVTNLLVTSIDYIGKEEELKYSQRKFLIPNEDIYCKIFLDQDIIKSAIIIGTKNGISLLKGNIGSSYKSIEEELNQLFSETK